MGYSLTYSLESRDASAAKKTKTAENTISNQEQYMMNAYMHSGGILIAPAVGE